MSWRYHASTAFQLAIIAMLLAACRRDPVVPGGLNCDCLRQEREIGEWQFEFPMNMIGGVRFNHRHPGEVIVTRARGHLDLPQGIWRHHPGSGNLVEVLSEQTGYVTSIPRGSWSGWITFAMASDFNPINSNIWIMKENGDSLTQLTFEGNSYGPLWDWHGERICYYKGAWQSYEQNQHNIMIDLSGAVLDTAEFFGAWWVAAAWTSSGTVVSQWYDGIYKSNAGHDVRKVHGWPGALWEDGIALGLARTADPDVFVWSHKCGLYRTKLSTGETEVLRCTDHSQYFVGLDYSPELNKLVSLWVTRTPINDHTLRITNDVVLMDPDGSNMQVIDIPFPE